MKVKIVGQISPCLKPGLNLVVVVGALNGVEIFLREPHLGCGKIQRSERSFDNGLFPLERRRDAFVRLFIADPLRFDGIEVGGIDTGFE